MNRTCTLAAAAVLIVSTTTIDGAQIGGKLVSGGNPTPGTEQPSPPSLADRITLTGCLRVAPKSAATTAAPDPNTPNTPSDSRFVLANAARVDRVPADTGGSALTSAATSNSYRLEGIDSQFSPFVNATVEISGEIRSSAAGAAASTSQTLIVEFVQRLAPSCK